MEFINNDPEQIRIRKSQNTLIVVGTGTILFGIWTALKMIGSLFMLKKETIEAMRKLAAGGLDQNTDRQVFAVTLAIALFATLILLLLRAFIGLSALAEGRGRRRHRLYIPAAMFMIVLSVLSFCANFFSVDGQKPYGALTPDTTFSGMIIELTSIIMLFEMVYSALMIRKLGGSKETGGSAGPATHSGKAGDR